jgi:hypothetical protein
MKKVIIYAFSIMLFISFLFINIYIVNAQSYNTFLRRGGLRSGKKYLEIHSRELNFKLLNFTYKEPEIGVKDKGEMYGIGVAYTYHNEIMLKLALDYYSGKINYESDSGRLNDVDQYIVEFKWLIGRDLPRYNSPIFDYLTPYTGFSYRYWKDNSGGKVTSLGKYGYDRETTYFYSPLGLETIKKLENEWFIGAIIEYDFFWKGKNISHLNDFDSSAPDLKFNQNDGYGFRFALKTKKAFDRVKIGITPFIHYWNIDKSEEIILFDPSNGFWVFYEPKNNTTEFGINLTAEF